MISETVQNYIDHKMNNYMKDIDALENSTRQLNPINDPITEISPMAYTQKIEIKKMRPKTPQRKVKMVRPPRMMSADLMKKSIDSESNSDEEYSNSNTSPPKRVKTTIQTRK